MPRCLTDNCRAVRGRSQCKDMMGGSTGPAVGRQGVPLGAGRWAGRRGRYSRARKPRLGAAEGGGQQEQK